MDTIDHKALYKTSSKPKDVFEIQQRTKETLLFRQNQQRERLLARKRLKVENLNNEADGKINLSSEEARAQVEQAAKMLKTSRKAEALTTLHHCFSKDHANIQTFFNCEALSSLQSCLLSNDNCVLHAAAWCAINLTTTPNSRLLSRAMGLSPLLIQFLTGSDSVMQELCAWAIGNLVGDSQSHRETLQLQGAIPHLLNLVSPSNAHLSEARSQSVLFAMINLSRDTKYDCIRCMQENYLFSTLQNLLKATPLTSELNFEIGWLTACIYSRKETLKEYKEQYEMILHLVLRRLAKLSELPESQSKQEMMSPYLTVCQNMFGLDPDLALLASDLSTFLPTMTSCLNCSSRLTQADTLTVLVNFAKEPSCRVLVVFHRDLLSRMFTLSPHTELASQLVPLLKSLSRVSVKMCAVLVEHGALTALSSLLSTTELAWEVLVVLEGLLEDTQLKSQMLPNDQLVMLKESLRRFISLTFDASLVQRAGHLLQYIS